MEIDKSSVADSRPVALLKRMDTLEVRICQRINALSRFVGPRVLFTAVSRLGDGLIWYLLMLSLPLAFGGIGLAVSVQMLVGGLIGLISYKSLKSRLVRERPFASHQTILCATAPLDRYSFPSGHTLHAVLFGILILSALPGLAPILIPFITLIACSRVVLGLHYPSDVLVGAALGWLIASLIKVSIPLSAFAPLA